MSLRVLITHRYSSRWANRFDKIMWFNDAGEITDESYIPVHDADIVCDLCNANFPEAYDAEVPIIQKQYPGEPWIDIGTRCQDCLKGHEELPRIKEDEQ